MAHVVETGSGSSTANAYLSAADADTYFTDHGAPSTWTAATTPNKEAALRQATQYLDATYHGRWRGTRANETQALAWPRADAEDDDGFTFSSTALPQALKDACAEAALAYLTDGDLIPDVDEPGTIGSEAVSVGPISTSTTYLGGKSQVVDRRKVRLLVAPLVEPAGTVWRG